MQCPYLIHQPLPNFPNYTNTVLCFSNLLFLPRASDHTGHTLQLLVMSLQSPLLWDPALFLTLMMLTFFKSPGQWFSRMCYNLDCPDDKTQFKHSEHKYYAGEMHLSWCISNDIRFSRGTCPPGALHANAAAPHLPNQSGGLLLLPLLAQPTCMDRSLYPSTQGFLLFTAQLTHYHLAHNFPYYTPPEVHTFLQNF